MYLTECTHFQKLLFQRYELTDKELTSKLLTSRENIFKQHKAELEKIFDELNNSKVKI